MHMVIVGDLVGVERHPQFYGGDVSWHVANLRTGEGGGDGGTPHLDGGECLVLLGVAGAVDAPVGALHLRLVPEAELLLGLLVDLDEALQRLL